MADSSHSEQHISPIGTVIREPAFPNITSHTPTSTHGSELRPSKTEGALHVDNSEEEPLALPKRVSTLPQPGTRRDNATNSRPLKQRWATERPKPSIRHSALQTTQSGSYRKKSAQLDRSGTLTFDPFSSASDLDSSDDEDLTPQRTASHANSLSKENTRNTRRTASGPFSSLKITNEHFKTHGKVSKADGRLKLNISEKEFNSGYIAKVVKAALRGPGKDEDDNVAGTSGERGTDVAKIADEVDEMEHDPSRRIQLNIVIIIIGSRGDIQPFIRIAKILKEEYGRRVRLATHPAFKDFVEKDSGLEFFSVGGNPSELMSYMVKNPGILPSLGTIKEGEIGRRRAQMYEMFQGMWRACINATDDETDFRNRMMMGDKNPFVADAIIANPPSFAAPHIAEKLGIPLHMMFTFPYTPTVQFPHPLANIKSTNVEATYSNFISYPLVELMVWQGLGDLVNRFRTQDLHLEEVSTLWAPGQLDRLKVPYTYMWSPGLIPKPKDWGPEIDISGFVFLDLASTFTPPEDLKKFLDDGEPPVYIGFGSIIVDDPDEFTKLIFKAVELVGCRALISKGWGGFGSNANSPDNIFMIDNTPHDWLFPRCAAVCHHGGAGTTAIGLKCAKPTMIVPFFGDQPFWGAMVAKAKAGAHECIPYKKLTAERLAEGLKQCLTEEANTNVKEIADSIAKEGDGAYNAVKSFHRSLPLRGEGSMRCDFLDNRVATWRLKNTEVKVSALAAEILVEKKRKLKWSDLRLIRHYEWNDFGGPGGPFTGVLGSVVNTLTDAATGVGGVPVEMGRTFKRRTRTQHQKRKASKPNKTMKGRPKQARTDPPDENAKREPEHEETLGEELGHEAVSGFRKTGGAIVRFPMNLTLGLTQGLHNAPRLYGDESVRRPPRVTGMHSGLRAGREELFYGVKDGVSGLVMQPYRGAKENGMVGAVRGVGYGLAGFVLKDLAALLGPSAYFMKGLDAEYMKRHQPTAYLRRSRIKQGQIDAQNLEKEDNGLEKVYSLEQTISTRWQALQTTIAEEKKHHKSGVMASLMGKGETKEGQRMPRKSAEVVTRDGHHNTRMLDGSYDLERGGKNLSKSLDRSSKSGVPTTQPNVSSKEGTLLYSKSHPDNDAKVVRHSDDIDNETPTTTLVLHIGGDAERSSTDVSEETRVGSDATELVTKHAKVEERIDTRILPDIRA